MSLDIILVIAFALSSDKLGNRQMSKDTKNFNKCPEQMQIQVNNPPLKSMFNTSFNSTLPSCRNL